MSNLQKLRVNAGLSQSKLAENTGISVRTIQMYELGSREVAHARIDVLLKLCLALNCNLSDLICPEFKDLYDKYMQNR
jgi:transcriptional regulator with XRE-family HTH domain